ncbi:di-heme oxidoredictase family protein [uncultured Aliiroseovarius sp.]|uniref:di-heme oxidoreductase family protein n=1 Tax=uncultured Aliiroseovarius sp. TaxID=1658783 RepID=UPI00262643B9|nr:di-heme oxidoredictase family protein [uncultured Aliiroseovarius sp.]
MTTKSISRASCALLSTALAIFASASFSEPLGEPHLEIAPRSKAEADRIAIVTAPTEDFNAPEPFELRPAGAATFLAPASDKSFYAASGNMPKDRELDFWVGSSLFEKLWVAPPSATVSSDGLGPLYNARACSACHPNNGRGRPPEGDGDRLGSLFLRVSIPDVASGLSADALALLPNAPEPHYGLQLQDKSVLGVPAEGRVKVSYETVPVTLGDGEVVELRKPTYTVEALGYGSLHPDTQLSPRVAPPMIGLGLLEAIPEADLLAHADPDDADGDGISGRANRVWSEPYGQWMTGRFGLKAGAPTVQAQSMDALNGDIGLSNPYRPAATGDCTELQTECMAAPDGNTPEQDNLEVGEVVMDLITFFARNVAPPQRRNIDMPEVLAGKEAFYTAGCTSCHVPKFVTHRLDDRPEQSFQLIWPYSDLLLHDMGEGLADNRPEWQATGREWRTPPLWGIGLTSTVSGQTNFLHDGRARTLLEAILWHGGEAEAAREAVRMMDKNGRDALIAFLESL